MENKCVTCGAIIPEGVQVCSNCQIQAIKKAAEASRNKVFVGALGANGEFRRYTKRKEANNDTDKTD